ncbi:MAG: DNA-3-methyladenine glycosylase [Bacteroidales bacterium]
MISEFPLLPNEFYQRTNVVEIARDLLGKVLVTNFDGIFTSGVITETEAYAGVNDRASHAYGDRHTRRTQIMYREGGYAYVYLCYGIHSLFNIVTNHQGVPHAVLIRAVSPLDGKEKMLERSGKTKIDRLFGIGPGKVSKILGIHYSHSGLPLTKELTAEEHQLMMWVEDHGIVFDQESVKVTPRVGVDYAREDALLPYRFVTWA